MKNSTIEWCDHTFNPWVGCTKVSPGCANCYAEAINSRFKGGNWGKGAPRRRTRAANWEQPLGWNRKADFGVICECGFRENWLSTSSPCPECKGTGTIRRYRPRVFCASMADWLDDEVPVEWLADLLKLIHDTPNLDWLLLTKRPQNWMDRIAEAMGHMDKDVPRLSREQALALVMSARSRSDEDSQKALEPYTRSAASLMLGEWLGGKTPHNIWIGTTVEDQARADERIPSLLKIPARVRFVSCEPLLGKVLLDNGSSGYLTCNGVKDDGHCCEEHDLRGQCFHGIDWVICGGESGPKARPMHPDWARSLRDQCDSAGVPFFFKQWGEWLPDTQNPEVNDPRSTETQAIKVGKKKAGRLLDGVEHNGFPKVEGGAL